MAIESIEQLIATAQNSKHCTLSVAAAHDIAVLKATLAAWHANVVTPLYVGHSDEIHDLLEQLGEDPSEFEIIHADSEVDCAKTAVRLVSEGRANFLMKGILGTATLLRAVLSLDSNLTTGRLMSHIMLFETPAYPKLLLLTDGGMNPAPDLSKKIHILTSGAEVLQKLGYHQINAACLSGAEVINPKILSTTDADALAHMDWTDYHMNVFGPVGLDLAVSPRACRHKGYTTPGCGDADILLVPNYETGNALYKSVLCFTEHCTAAGIIAGAKCPIVLTSRSDSAKSKLASIALGTLLSQPDEA